jgi:5-(aminomethyl)-3-furanmethanol phosphate kinase
MSRTQIRRAEGTPRHLVVKLGGSLWSSPQLKDWLAALRQARFPLTIVPGGGVFADAVRVSQERMGFSDAAAHAMALLAMEQYALALADLDPTLTLASSPQDAARAHALGRAALWRPSEAVLAAPDIPPSWDVTSDSLAAWFATKSDASALLLVKSVDAANCGEASPGLVDSCFWSYAREIPVFIAGPSNLAGAARALAQGTIPGIGMKADVSERKIAI